MIIKAYADEARSAGRPNFLKMMDDSKLGYYVRKGEDLASGIKGTSNLFVSIL